LTAASKVWPGDGKVVLFSVSSPQTPTSSATPITGGKTLSHSARQSNGTRAGRAVTLAAASLTLNTAAVGALRVDSLALAGSGSGVVSSGEWKTAETMS